MDEADFINELLHYKENVMQQFPDKQEANKFIDELFAFLYISPLGKEKYSHALATYQQLRLSFFSLLIDLVKEEEGVNKNTSIFFSSLPQIYKALLKDAGAIMDTDPAAKSITEVIIAYPGFYATAVYRLSHQLWNQELYTLSRLFCEYAHSKTGIDIHPAAIIGNAFAIDHGTGIVIGETSVIGKNVKLYQGVTLGAINVNKENVINKRHPTIGDDVVIYAGATILGGETFIGNGSIIGGNVWLTQSVPSNSVVYHTSEIKVRDKNPFPEPLNFVI